MIDEVFVEAVTDDLSCDIGLAVKYFNGTSDCKAKCKVVMIKLDHAIFVCKSAPRFYAIHRHGTAEVLAFNCLWGLGVLVIHRQHASVVHVT